jgi:regulator of protease activity HflC (stomatin/prohibitin superfamily)
VLTGLGFIGAFVAQALPAWSGPAGATALVVAFLLWRGTLVVMPNRAVVLVFFGRYVGTVREPGFFWVNPLTSKTELSLRARNMGSDKVKVNDRDGNPVEVGAVTVWRIRDTAQASFDVDDLVAYVDVQIEAAVRELAQAHPYDGEEGEVSLRSDTQQVAGELLDALQARLDRAGVEVVEARISHLAYAPEIAGAMLQRQQASAVVAARRKIVEGAVGMVEHALHDLSERNVVELSNAERGRLVGNLLVVLCGQAPAQPVLSAGQ